MDIWIFKYLIYIFQRSKVKNLEKNEQNNTICFDYWFEDTKRTKSFTLQPHNLKHLSILSDWMLDRISQSTSHKTAVKKRSFDEKPLTLPPHKRIKQELSPSQASNGSHTSLTLDSTEDVMDDLLNEWSIQSPKHSPLFPPKARTQDVSHDKHVEDTHVDDPMDGCYAIKRKGWVNLGNMCYINATLQALLGIKSLGYSIFHPYLTLLRDMKSDNLVYILKSLLEDDSMSSTRNATPIKLAMGKLMDIFLDNEQQDAHEFLSAFLAQFSEILEPGLLLVRRLQYDVSFRSYHKDVPFEERATLLCPIKRHFGGMFRIVMTCEKCKHKTEKNELFRDISLQLSSSNDSSSDETLSLDDLLTNFFSKEVIERKCSCGHDKTRLTKQILQLPRVLILHLKRSSIVHNIHGHYRKLVNPVSYPMNLNIQRFCSEHFHEPIASVERPTHRLRPLFDLKPPSKNPSSISHTTDSHEWVAHGIETPQNGSLSINPGTPQTHGNISTTLFDDGTSSIKSTLSTNNTHSTESYPSTPSTYRSTTCKNNDFNMDEEAPPETFSSSMPPLAFEYDIHSLIHHMGQEITSGHYITHVRDPSGWVECDDEKIRAIDPTLMPTFTHSSTAYIFFYVHKKFC